VEQIRSISNNKDFQGFTSGEELFQASPEADILLICTQDEYHFDQSMKALNQGYDILLEKPVSNNLDEVLQIQKTAKKLNRRVVVCHVLRYTPFYRTIKKIIQDGILGDITAINASEGIGAWHFAHSFVRGHWSIIEESSPTILAKCCHDMDILHWLLEKKCVNLSSQGSLNHFTQEHLPKGAPERCHLGCPVEKECIYNSAQYANKHVGWLRMLRDHVDTLSEKEIMDWVAPSNWGRCVYQCKNTALDNQVVLMEFENKVSVTLTMNAFDEGRNIEISGTKAFLKGGHFCKKHTDQDLVVQDHNGNIAEKINIDLNKEQYGHMGGDEGLINELYTQMREWPLEKVHANLDQVIHGHTMAFKADQARLAKKIINL
jgi:predicted dehydrogenase